MASVDRPESPLISSVLKKKNAIHTSRQGFWVALNLILAVSVYLEITYSISSELLQIDHPVIWYIECCLAVLVTLNTVANIIRYLQPTLFPSPIELTSAQKRLLGVKDSDLGFKTSTSKKNDLTSSPQRPIFSPSFLTHTHSPHSPSQSPSPSSSPSMLPHLTPSPSTLGGSLNVSHSPLDHSRSFAGSVPGYSPHSRSVSHNYSGTVSPGALFNQSSPSVSQMMNVSHHSQNSFSRPASSSPFTPNLSPLFRESTLDTSGLRSRFNVSARGSPLSSEDCVTNLGTLSQYLKEQDEKDMKRRLGAIDNSPSSGPSFWNFNRTVADYTPILRKYQYQIACRSPQSTKSRSDDDPDDHATYRSEEVWSRLDVHRDELDKWIENLRKWLSHTIFVRLVKEIEKINKELRRLGNDDMIIGEVSIATLKQLAVTKGLQVPSLNAVVPYLEVCANQEYLVNRIKELGSDGCMAQFRWDKGGDHKGKPWAEHLPTDSVIVMHMLCTYMDCRLPPHPKYPDGKTFTNAHFIKTPDKPNLTKKDNLCIFQSRINPPYYKVALADDLWEVPKGRNNLFQAILLFIHHIKNKEHGRLGRVSLGLSGINILGVLESTT